ncbi:MAG: hypothetical protein BWY17_01704 [Deltaproteobacteria bacterium ADurb.Bin207]|nr:MAG: hypothetical protein BWY17_04594 [Deltaproteobacteria bacterium ADurb.Bin207]OQB11622.1 MAG: hypothetical protein BWY17_03609 [Deltaproteobacteria bacterium ADurb.Bin207]OQB12127.1 MAG: hypothetical protein BWY17_03349 [Deltaproteobacteria bacterium ADurb.Bin207]OQB15079.1 MAG: hypothetical protein BWY17_02365 [Deltaproteobacteria bacterium ADurb.Bin207]OQB16378.1 MAG: hypothetical protein BWY17_01704 [Deltaproteobacteria bacterium ADurb.Bin207]
MRLEPRHSIGDPRDTCDHTVAVVTVGWQVARVDEPTNDALDFIAIAPGVFSAKMHELSGALVDAPEPQTVRHLPRGAPRVIDVSSQSVSIARRVDDRTARFGIPRRTRTQNLSNLLNGTVNPPPIHYRAHGGHVRGDGGVFQRDGTMGEERQRLLSGAERMLAAEPSLPFQA